jgi:hypothetical protein
MQIGCIIKFVWYFLTLGILARYQIHAFHMFESIKIQIYETQMKSFDADIINKRLQVHGIFSAKSTYETNACTPQKDLEKNVSWTFQIIPKIKDSSHNIIHVHFLFLFYLIVFITFIGQRFSEITFAGIIHLISALVAPLTITNMGDSCKEAIILLNLCGIHAILEYGPFPSTLSYSFYILYIILLLARIFSRAYGSTPCLMPISALYYGLHIFAVLAISGILVARELTKYSIESKWHVVYLDITATITSIIVLGCNYIF